MLGALSCTTFLKLLGPLYTFQNIQTIRHENYRGVAFTKLGERLVDGSQVAELDSFRAFNSIRGLGISTEVGQALTSAAHRVIWQ